jgi:hypothetical protein
MVATNGELSIYKAKKEPAMSRKYGIQFISLIVVVNLQLVVEVNTYPLCFVRTKKLKTTRSRLPYKDKLLVLILNLGFCRYNLENLLSAGVNNQVFSKDKK